MHELCPRLLDFDTKAQMYNFLSLLSETFYVETTVQYKVAAHRTGSVLIDIRLICVRAAQKQAGLLILSVRLYP
jgi:hypothetical protein